MAFSDLFKNLSLSPNWEEGLAAIPLLLGSYEAARGRPIGALAETGGELLQQHAGYRRGQGDVAAMQQQLQGLDPKTSPAAVAQWKQLQPLLGQMSPELATKQIESVLGLSQSEQLAQYKYRKPNEFYNSQTHQFEYHQPEEFKGGVVPPNLLPWQVGKEIETNKLTDKTKYLNYGDDFNRLLAQAGFKSPSDFGSYQAVHPAEAQQLSANINAKIRQEKLDAARQLIWDRNADKPLSGKDSYDYLNSKGEHMPAGVYTPETAAAGGFRYINEKDQLTFDRTKLGLSDLRDAEDSLSILRTGKPASFVNTQLRRLKGDPLYTKLHAANTAMLAAASLYSSTLRINQNELNIFRSMAFSDTDTVGQAQEKIRQMRRRMKTYLNLIGMDPNAVDTGPPKDIDPGDAADAAAAFIKGGK